MAADPDSAPKTIGFHYIKAPSFRDLHVDGMIGGVTPKGLLHLACYAERHAIPTMVTQEIDAVGKLGREIDVLSRGGIVRELQADLFMDLTTAESLRDWLEQAIKASKEQTSSASETDSSGDR